MQHSIYHTELCGLALILHVHASALVFLKQVHVLSDWKTARVGFHCEKSMVYYRVLGCLDFLILSNNLMTGVTIAIPCQ